MTFKDGTGKTLEIGQKCVYMDQGLMDCEVIDIEDLSIMDGTGQRRPRVAVKLYLNFPAAPPDVRMILVGNLRVVEDVQAKKSIGDLTKH